MGDMTREKRAVMTDQELLAYERAHHGDLYVSLLRAKGMQRVALQFWHVGMAGRRGTERPRRRRGVGCFRRCFRPTPLVSVSPTTELDVAKVGPKLRQRHRLTGRAAAERASARARRVGT